MRIFRKKAPTPSAESVAAKRAAEFSARRAEEDLARVERKLEESRPVIEDLRARNHANHYDRWIEQLLGIPND
jgi:hypothetical protein